MNTHAHVCAYAHAHTRTLTHMHKRTHAQVRGKHTHERTHTHTHTLGRTTVEEGSACRTGTSLTTHNTQSKYPVGFRHVIPTIQRPRTHAVDRAATGIGICY